MSDVIISTNMLLPVPIVGQAPGPDWATDINACLSIIDGHTHTAGSGVPITSSAINVNADLTFNGYNGINFRSVRLQTQGSPLALAADVGCLYRSGVDLYFNDGSGNQIRITQSGAVTGSAGTITGLPSGTASASYSAGIFTFQSATNTAADIDVGSVYLRNSTASSKYLLLTPPAAMAADYSLILPPLPASQKIMTLDASGNITAPYTTDNSTLEISSNLLRIKDQGVTAAKILNNTITRTQIATSGVLPTERVEVFTSNGTFTTKSDVTEVTIIACGGGGGGASGNGSAAGGGGAGGGGAPVFIAKLTVSASTGYAIVIGAGGAGGAGGGGGDGISGSAGSSTTGFGLTFPGGNGGIHGSGATGGTGVGAYAANYINGAASGNGGPLSGPADAGSNALPLGGAAGTGGSNSGSLGGGGGGGASIGNGGNGGAGGVAGSVGGYGGGGGGGGSGGASLAGGTGGAGYMAIRYVSGI